MWFTENDAILGSGWIENGSVKPGHVEPRGTIVGASNNRQNTCLAKQHQSPHNNNIIIYTTNINNLHNPPPSIMVNITGFTQYGMSSEIVVQSSTHINVSAY